MADDMLIAPSPGDDNYTSLSKQKIGRTFRKQLFKMNSEFVDPRNKGKKIKIDKEFADKMVHNFNTSGIPVQLPLVNDANQHVEDPDRNLGEVISVDYDDNGVYAIIDARKNAENFGKTYLGSSAMYSENYTNSLTGENMGPTLLHVAVTNRPYLNNLDEYTEVMSLSADTKDETPVLLTLMQDEVSEVKTVPKAEVEPVDEKEVPMTKDELLAAVKAQLGIDVVELQSQATKTTELSAEVETLTTKVESLTGELTLSGEKIVEAETISNAVIELSASNEALASKVAALTEESETLKLSAATTEIDSLISTGRILPKQKEAMIKLSMSDPETFNALLPEQPIVKLSETGYTVHESPETDAETRDRYKTIAQNFNKPKTR